MYKSATIIFVMIIFIGLVLLFAQDTDYINNRGIIPVNYEAYGEFKGINTNKFRYKIRDIEGLKKEVGDFVYPNFMLTTKQKKRYKELLKNNMIQNNVWSNFNSGNPEADLLVWLSTDVVYGNEEEFAGGIKQFFIAEILREIGEYSLAIKAYYSVIINFPKSACWNSDGSFVWYVAPVALNRINILIREHPEFNLKLEDAYIEVINGNDTNFKNDIIKVNPGRFVRVYSEKTTNLRELEILKIKGTDKVKLVQYSNKHWQMLVDNKPFTVKGITYSPTKVGGASSDQNKWMFLDSNNNGILDVNEVWVDSNNNNNKDPEEESISDFQLLKDMGVNAIRFFHTKSSSEYLSNEYNKELMREIYNKYGIRFIMGDFLGAYGIGSGGKYTDYKNKNQREMMKENVIKMVIDHKDEPYVLMWLIGNENDMPSLSEGVNYTNTNARDYPDAYASLLKETIDTIHALDKEHPVAVGNMTLDLMKNYKDNMVDIDVYGINLYMGKDGFGGIWNNISTNLDVPVLITEYGCDAYFEGKGEDEIGQDDYHIGNWKDIDYNSFGKDGIGNSIGGVVFEWLDEWWKSGINISKHETSQQSSLPFPDGYSHEEWFGVASQGDGQNSPFQRNLRKVYFSYRYNLWRDK
ncbi:MAG: hypothetical protein LBF97_08345 [Elusimicrobiota bacterium]|jgi:beta-glucuronidase|nr:hypothetical protein [Elusimicrobiota bacterium]